MKKQILTAVASLAVVAAMSVSAFAVESGTTNGKADGKVENGKVTLDNSVTLDGGLKDGATVEVDVEPVAEAAAKEVLEKIAKDTEAKVEVKAVNTVVSITAEDGTIQEDGSVKVTVASDGVSNGVIYIGEDGKVENLPTTVDEKAGTITFTTTHFSDFYLVTLADQSGNTGDNTNAKTGVVLAVVPAIAAAAAIVVSKKRK